MRSCCEILFVALLIQTGWSYPHHSRETCSLCSPGTRILHACTPVSDTVCTPCGPDTYSDAPNNASRCQLCSKCPESTYITRSCSQTSDIICSPCSTSPQAKSTNYLTSCGKPETVSDPHDLMMGDDAGGGREDEGANNHNVGDEEPSDAVKEEGDHKHADEAKNVGSDNKDDISNTANDNENTADDSGKEKKDDSTNVVKEEAAGNSEDNAVNGDKTAGSEHHETKDGESVKKETEIEHAAQGGSEAAHPATDDAAGETRHDTAGEPSQDTPEEPPQDTPDEPPQDNPDEPPQDTPDEPPQDTPDEPPKDTPNEPVHDTADEPPQDTPNEPVHDTADEPPQDTPNEPVHDTAAEPPQDTPNEPVHDTADEPPKDTPNEPVHNTAAEPPQDTPNEPVHDTAAEPPQDTPKEPVHDTADEPPQDTPNEPVHDTVDEAPQDTPDATDDSAAETVHDTGDEAVHDTSDKTVHDTGDETVHDTADKAAQDTENKNVHDTVDETTDSNTDETGAEPGDTVDDETGDDAGDETKKDDGNEAPGETGGELVHDITDGAAEKKADESTLDTENEATGDAAGKVDNNTEDKAPSETTDGEVGSEGAHNSTSGAGDGKVDEPPQGTGDEPGSDVEEKTEDNQGDNVAAGDAGDGMAHEAVDGSEDDENLHSPRVLEPEHKEFGGDHPEESHVVNDTIVLPAAPDGHRENTSDDNPADSISLDINAESSDASSHTNTEHDAELLSSTHEHSENTTGAEGKDGEEHLILTDKGEEGTTESPEDNKSSLHLLHGGIEEPHSDDNNNTEALANTDEESDIQPALGRILSADTKNATQDEESGSPGETPTSSPHVDEIVDIGAISLNDSENVDTGLTGSNETESLNVVIDDPGHAPVVVINDSEITTAAPDHPEEEVHELTTTAAIVENSTADDGGLDPLFILDVAKEETKDADKAGAEVTGLEVVEEVSTAKTPESGDVSYGEGGDLVEVVTVSMKSTKRIPTLEELEAQYTEPETGSGDGDYVIVRINGKDHTTKSDASDAQNRALSGEHKIAEGGIGSSHQGDEEYEDNKRTAIIVGVTIGGVALFALGFFASRYYKKRRGQFKEMKKVNSGKDVEALEFEPLQQNDSKLPPSNGIYRPRGKASPPFPLKKQREDKADVEDLYTVPEKSTRAPLLGLTPPIEELSQSPSAQEPLMSGVEKLKYIDDSTDDEYVNTVRTSLLPSRSPASRLTNVVEETPPTSPSITQPYRPNWSTNQSKSGGSSSYTNGSTPKHTHSSVSSQGSLTNDVMNALPNQTQVKTDNRNNRVNRKQAHSDEDIEC